MHIFRKNPFFPSFVATHFVSYFFKPPHPPYPPLISNRASLCWSYQFHDIVGCEYFASCECRSIYWLSDQLYTHQSKQIMRFSIILIFCCHRLIVTLQRNWIGSHGGLWSCTIMCNRVQQVVLNRKLTAFNVHPLYTCHADTLSNIVSCVLLTYCPVF